MRRSLLLYICLLVFCLAFSSHIGVLASETIGITVDRVEDGGVLHACKYCGRSMRVGPISRDAEGTIESTLQDKMREKGLAYGEGSDFKRFINVHVFRFEQRKGGNFAADKPASVGFHMHLMEGKTVGKVYEFDEQQKPLLSNLLEFGKFVERGGRWIKAERLAEEGIEKGLNYMMEALEK
jgi:hypothetical protein